MNNKLRIIAKEEVKSDRDRSRDYKRLTTNQLNTGTTRNTITHLKSGGERITGGTLVMKKKFDNKDDDENS